MGILTPILSRPRPADGTPAITAAERINGTIVFPIPDTTGGMLSSPVVSRAQAMQVPAVAQARNLICQTIGTLPLSQITPEGLPVPDRARRPWLGGPIDAAEAAAVTLAWTVDDLMFHGRAWWQITQVYADMRPTSFRRIDPARVGWETGPGNTVKAWTVDGRAVPALGVGALVYFAGLEEGLLTRAGSTIRTALDLELAAARYAAEPLPTVVLKNKGAPMTGAKIDELLSVWKAARRSRGTGFTQGDIEAEYMGWSAAEIQLSEARQYVAAEIARACNVPGHYLGAATGTASMTYANVRDERRSLTDHTFRGFIAAIEQRLSAADVLPAGHLARFDLADFLRGDPAAEASTLIALVDAGLLDRDEGRARLPYTLDPDTDPTPTPTEAR